MSSEGEVAFSEVKVHNLSTEKIQAKEPINARAWRKCVRQHREITTLLAHRSDLSNNNTRSEFHSTARSDLDPIGSQRRLVAYGCQRRNVDHSPCSARVQGQAQNDGSRRTGYLGLDHNETAFRIERVAHNTTAVSSGISPV